MKLLLDTHVLIWALTDDPRLSAKAREWILDEENTVCCSVVSLWEVALKHAAHPDSVSFTGEELAGFCREAGYQTVEMKEKHVFTEENLQRAEGEPAHHDPFDRMLIAQAKADNMVFLTHDSLLLGYGEKCVVYV